MDFGLGLPITNPGHLIDWARHGEAAGFDSVAMLDRLVFDNPEPLIALAALAGATRRVRLQTEVLLGPLRSTALLAKQISTLDRMSNGRFVLGVGVGGRPDDFAAAGVPITRRGQILDQQLHDLRRIWNGDNYTSPSATDQGGAIGPEPSTPGGPTVLIGAFAPAALARVARHGDGFLCAAPPQWAGGLIRHVADEWVGAGRSGTPRIVAQVNVAIGSNETIRAARTSIAQYYAFTGQDGWGAPISDPIEISETVDQYRDLGVDEIVFYCYADDRRQIDKLANLLL